LTLVVLEAALAAVTAWIAGSTVVPNGRKLTQRLEKRWRQQQHEEALPQAEWPAPCAEMECAQQVEPNVGRDHRDAERREEFEHRRRQERDAQHGHRAAAQRLRGVAEPLGREVDSAERTQRGKAAQPVEQEGVHAAHLDHLRLAGGAGAPADECHEHGDQWRRNEQHQRGDPREARDHEKNHQRHERDAQTHRLIAHEIRHERFGLLGDHAGGGTGGGPMAVER